MRLFGHICYWVTSEDDIDGFDKVITGTGYHAAKKWTFQPSRLISWHTNTHTAIRSHLPRSSLANDVKTELFLRIDWYSLVNIYSIWRRSKHQTFRMLSRIKSIICMSAHAYIISERFIQIFTTTPKLHYIWQFGSLIHFLLKIPSSLTLRFILAHARLIFLAADEIANNLDICSRSYRSRLAAIDFF